MKLTRIGQTNATVIRIADGEILFSYSTPVAAFVAGRGYLRTAQHHSVTTSRHINAWIDGPSTTIPQAELDALAKMVTL